eukprot:TRINITY_DN876_c0_g1_i4.p1 TRINITY_DN876_c0_g1~~TRINITY_DN876_c0_g1_i4.p1  ORF type:complete len:616 (-),score=104.47 TRINITY_DN876_c0_g1_i4:1129-2976(-)
MEESDWKQMPDEIIHDLFVELMNEEEYAYPFLLDELQNEFDPTYFHFNDGQFDAQQPMNPQLRRGSSNTQAALSISEQVLSPSKTGSAFTLMSEDYSQVRNTPIMETALPNGTPQTNPTSNDGTLSIKQMALNDSYSFPVEMIQNLQQPSMAEQENLLNARELVYRYHHIVSDIQAQLDVLRSEQSHVLSSEAGEETDKKVKELQEKEDNLKLQIEREISMVSNISTMVVLEAEWITQIRGFKTILQSAKTQLEIYQSELIQMTSPMHLANRQYRLVIMNEPVTHVIFKGKVMENPFVLRLLHGATYKVDNTSEVVALLETHGLKHKVKNPLVNDVSQLDGYLFHAHFNNIKVNISSRMNVLNLKFAVNVRIGDSNVQVESSLSNPFIVITNESQWCDAISKLLQLECFQGQHDHQISWPFFCNKIQEQFILNTRPKTTLAERPITYHEFQYFKQKIIGQKNTVTLNEAQTWFAGFSQIQRAIRFKRHIYSLWVSGFIYCFMSKESCTNVLAQQGIGTFILRFSESQPGLFAIAYVAALPNGVGANRVKHYLVKSEDIGPRKSLPDFIRRKEQFQYILKIDPRTGKVNRFAKEEAFSKYYSKRKPTVIPYGYSEL